jgi:sulfoxide reductase heme-binding subunit YedZ
MNYTGHSAMIAFVITLSITPLRSWLTHCAIRASLLYGKRLSDWNFLVYNRRMMGLVCYYYASFHGFIYLYFELDFDWFELWFDTTSRIHIFLGIISWLLLSLLAITSPIFMQKKLKNKWRTIHRLIYIIALTLFGHILYEAKLIDYEIKIYASFIGVFLGHRIIVFLYTPLKNKTDDGMEVFRR